MLKTSRTCFVVASFAISLLLNFAEADPIINAPISAPPVLIPAAPSTKASHYVLMDAQSSKVLAQKNMDEKRPPASLTKLMTLYLAFQALKNSTIKLDGPVRISSKAWKMSGSKMFVRVGTEVKVEDLIRGIVIDSGNDACVAMSEFVAGSEEAFVDMMNQQAKVLGMSSTHYTDCTGMPNADHYTTAHDLSLLAQAIIQNFPEYYHYFSEKWFSYNGIRQPNRNRLLWRFSGTDGLKTGHTDEAGFCLIASAVQNNERLIVTILNAPGDEARANDSIQLLTYGFRFYTSRLLYRAGVPITKVRIWFGSPNVVEAGVAHDLYITTSPRALPDAKMKIKIRGDLKAPLTEGSAVGEINVLENDQVVETVPLVTLKPVTSGGFVRRSVDHSARIFHLLRAQEKEIAITPPVQ
jgi:D-alanyl-D-alanine carboxypeptidase (penicillin-binding protein 5/6)